MRSVARLVFVGGLWSSTATAAPTEPSSLLVPLDDAGACLDCHAFFNPQTRADEAPFAPVLWQGSMMANAARDPVFWAAVAIADQDAPGQTDACIRCHAPNAFLEGRGDSVTMDALTSRDLDGVACDLCHRMVDDGQTPPGNALYTIDDLVGDEGVPRRGPWSYGARDLAPSHDHSGPDAFLASSRLCGTCHDVTTESEQVDARGRGTGLPFAEQRTYSEWAGSDFAVEGPGFRSCQDCHMPAIADVAGCEANNLVAATHAEGGRRHDLVGANRFVVGMMKGLYASGGSGEFLGLHFDRTIERMDALLAQAATLELSAPPVVDVQAGLVDLLVIVTNESGHKLPTGYSEGRVAWLEVTASYAGETVWSSGQWSPDDGLHEDPQLHRYHAVAEHAATGDIFHLMRSNRWAVDDRLPPRGLVANGQTDPVTNRYTLQDDGTWPHVDEVRYDFAPAEVADANGQADDQLQIAVRLLYLVNTPDYVAFLADDNATTSAGAELAELFDEFGPNEPLVLAEASLSVPLTGLDPTPQADSTGDPPTTGSGTTTGGESTTSSTATNAGSTGQADTSGPGAAITDAGCTCHNAEERVPPSWLALFVLLAMRRPISPRTRRARTHRGSRPTPRLRCTPGARRRRAR